MDTRQQILVMNYHPEFLITRPENLARKAPGQPEVQSANPALRALGLRGEWFQLLLCPLSAANQALEMLRMRLVSAWAQKSVP